MKLRSHLILLVLAAVLPLLIFAGLMFWRDVQVQRDTVERGMRDAAHALSLAVDREVGTARAILETLAASPYLDSGDFKSFYELSSRAAEKRKGSAVLLFDRTGQQIINTGRPFGASLPNTLREGKESPAGSQEGLSLGTAGTVKQVLETGEPVISDLFIGLVSKQPTLSITVPVIREGKIAYALGLGIQPQNFTALLLEQGLPSDWFAAIVDRRGMIIARTLDPERFLGRPARPELIAEMLKSEEGWESRRSLEGVMANYAFSRSKLTGWTTDVAVPQAVIEAPVIRSIRTLTAGAALLLLLAVSGALVLGRRISVPLSSLAGAAEAIQRGEAVELKNSAVEEVESLQEAILRAGAAARAAVEEREGRLVAEARRAEAEAAHHRVTANLAITQILAESPTLHEATPRILQKIGEILSWQVGDFWIPDPEAKVLRCFKVWHDPSARAERFVEAICARTFAAGVGLPGRVWKNLRPAWIPDVTGDDNFPRAPHAVEAGLHAGFAFPILFGEKFLGVMEFFSREIREPDDALLAMFEGIGAQIGQFIVRKQAEDERREIEERFRLMVQSVNDYAILRLDPEGRVVTWNAGAERIKGYRAEEIIGRHFSCFYTMEDRQRGKPQELLRLALQEGRAEEEGWRVRKDGSTFWADVVITPLRDQAGRLRGFAKVTRDLSERKRAEEALKEFNVTLEQRVAERTEELAKTNHELFRSLAERERLEEDLREAHKMQAIGTLAGGIAHDFNNFLAIIVSNATELKKDGLSPHERSESVEAVVTASKRGAAVVQQLLTFARRTPVARQAVRVEDLLGEFMRMIRPAFPKTVELSLEIETHLPTIPVNADQIQQALLNLCLNSRDAMPEGGRVVIRAGIETCRSAGNISSQAMPGDYFRISVSDTGIGMDEETRSRAFDPFFTTKQKSGGTGLGLAVVYGIVRNHGGFIEIDSAKDRGTEFRLYFPVQTEATALRKGA